MFGLGTWELLLILAIVIVIFGAGKLPMIGSNLGKGIRNFRKSLQEAKDILPKGGDESGDAEGSGKEEESE
jgi:sec-independent protein translocase protein TatA